MIECSSQRLPPTGCLQYFTGEIFNYNSKDQSINSSGTTGTVSSFNLRDGCSAHPCTHLLSQQYTVYCTLYTVHSTQYPVHGTQYTVHYTQYTSYLSFLFCKNNWILATCGHYSRVSDRREATALLAGGSPPTPIIISM